MSPGAEASAIVPPWRPVAFLYVVPAQAREVEVGEPACRPGSVRPLARGGGHPSGTAVAGSLVRSTREHRAGRPRSLAQGAAGSPLDLAPGGVYRAAAVTCGAGGLLHHRFTLTPADAGAVCFLWHCPAGHPGSALPTTLPCGARTFLTGLAPGATARPTHPCSGYAGFRRARVANRTSVVRGEVREQAILAAVIELLGEDGYEAMTMDAVAARAHASKTTIYRRWRGKPELVKASSSGWTGPGRRRPRGCLGRPRRTARHRRKCCRCACCR